VQRIFNCNKIKNTSFTSDKVLNILIWKLFYVIIYTSYKLLKCRFFGLPSRSVLCDASWSGEASHCHTAVCYHWPRWIL